MSTTTTLASGNFLIPDATFLAEIVAFLLILAFMWKYVVPPLQKNLSARQDVIRQQLEDARHGAQAPGRAGSAGRGRRPRAALARPARRGRSARARADAASCDRRPVDALTGEGGAGGRPVPGASGGGRPDPPHRGRHLALVP